MSFIKSKARQPEIIAAVQKDLTYTNELSSNLSEILRIAGPQAWIRYNKLCQFIAEIGYHGFASINNLQTLGEEYTGIIQIDSNYIELPSKIIKLLAIVLEFLGEVVFLKVLQKMTDDILKNHQLRPEAKVKLLKLIEISKAIAPYIKGYHKTIFYFQSIKYQLSKRVTGINYVLVRRWLSQNQSLYGYKILGFVTFIQLSLSLILNIKESLLKNKNQDYQLSRNDHLLEKDINIINKTSSPACVLCLEPRRNTSLTPCGHLFCWTCIIDWLNEKDECPICREHVKKPNVVVLQNYL